ncbi:MAG: hypothetical protein JO347_12330 [Candidatus Eremiobacteraeota bacterium]|nr:hypothetical protein [Candidatus Eremiobacteraeota bacterium]
MRTKNLNSDPIAAAKRKSVAARSVGVGNRCTVCGENCPNALIAGSEPMICHECRRRSEGRSIYDQHHVAGRANHGLTIPVPEDSRDGQPHNGYKFRGHFLDLKTLAFALTDRGHSLKSACEAFGVERGKMEVAEHGKLTEEYIHYNRRDVEATAQLAEKLLQEYDLHPISLPETKAFSPASIGKAYLREMDISPIAQRQKSLQPYVGYAQTAYFGGRTSAHISQGGRSCCLHGFSFNVSDRE